MKISHSFNLDSESLDKLKRLAYTKSKAENRRVSLSEIVQRLIDSLPEPKQNKLKKGLSNA